MTKYFQWQLDGMYEKGWYLSPPENLGERNVSVWAYSRTELLDLSGLALKANFSEGTTVTNVCFAAFGIIYLRSKLALALQEALRHQIQLIPVAVPGVNDEIFILNILNEVDCIDESRSVYEKWDVGNSVRPDKAGMYKAVYDLKIDENRTKNLGIFRLWGWHMAVIVSEEIRDIVEAVGAESTIFQSAM